MWLFALLGAWLVVGLLVGLFFAVLARGGSGNHRTAHRHRPPSPSLL